MTTGQDPSGGPEGEPTLTELIQLRRKGPIRRKVSPVAGFFGDLLVGMGSLVMILCGLCTGGGLFLSLLTELSEYRSRGYFELVALVVGGVPIAVGFVIYRVGCTLRGD